MHKFRSYRRHACTISTYYFLGMLRPVLYLCATTSAKECILELLLYLKINPIPGNKDTNAKPNSLKILLCYFLPTSTIPKTLLPPTNIFY